MLGKILHIGLPSAGKSCVDPPFYDRICVYRSHGKRLAAQTLYFQLSLFIMLFGISISIGNEIMVGHLVGAKRFEDAFRRGVKSLKMGFYVTIGVVIAFWLFRDPILNNITDDQGIIKVLLPLFLLSVFLEPGRTIIS